MSNSKINKLMADLKGQYGDNTVMFAGDMPVRGKVSCGSLALDFACGGGFPSDRVVEIAGEESTGKSTLAVLAMTQVLDANPDRGALVLDIEHKLSPEWLEFLVGPERMQRVIYSQPEHAEQATNVYKRAVKTGSVACVIFDSIGGAPTIRRNEDAEVASYGGNSIAITEFARTAAVMSAKYDCLTMGINQTRADVAGYHRLITPGGNGWKHACILRIQLVKGKGKVHEEITGEKVQIGYTVVGKVIKNQQAAPGRSATWWFFNIPTEKWGFGVDTREEIVRLGVLTKVFDVRGGWYYHNLLPADAKGEHKLQGYSRLSDYVREHPEIYPQLRQEVLVRLDDVASEVAPISDPEEPPVEDQMLEAP